MDILKEGDERRLIHKVPCKECPWRKNAPQGYVGGHNPEWYADVVSDNQVPSCHLRDNGPNNPKTGYCVGALHTISNASISPHDPKERAAAKEVGGNSDCFEHPSLFYNYHTKGGIYVSRLIRRLTGAKST